MLLSICEFHEKWCRKGHTFLMGASDITFKKTQTFSTPLSRPCHSTSMHHLDKVLWHFVGTAMTVMEVIRIDYHYCMFWKHNSAFDSPTLEMINLGIPWVRTTKHSEQFMWEKRCMQKSRIGVSLYTYPTNCPSTSHPSFHSMACVATDLCISNTLLTYFCTYLLHGAESFLWSWQVLR
jgi:hypothetical protein